MIADALRLVGIRKPSQLRFEPIDEQSTITALKSGREAAETLLGKTLQNTVEELGARISGWATGVTNRGGLWIRVKLSYKS
jgi:hypothetical protein